MSKKQDKKNQKVEVVVEVLFLKNIKKDNSYHKTVSFTFKFEIQQNVFTKQETDSNPEYILMWEWFNSQNVLTRYESQPFQVSETQNEQKISLSNTIDLIMINDEFCKTICSKSFYFYIVNCEDQQVKEHFCIDYSQILMNKSITPKIQEFKKIQISLESNKELMSQIYRHYLNPMQVTIVGTKNLPSPNQNFQPIYIQYKFFDKQIIKSQEVEFQEKIKWNSKHVILIGLLDQIQLIELIKQKSISLEIHDCDQEFKLIRRQEVQLMNLDQFIVKEEVKQVVAPVKGGKPEPKKPEQKKVEEKKPEPKKDSKKGAKVEKKEMNFEPILVKIQDQELRSHKFGNSVIHLTGLLDPLQIGKDIKIKSSIAPVNHLENSRNNNQLQLNTIANIEPIKPDHEYPPYYENDAYIIISFLLDFPINSYKEPGQQDKEQNDLVFERIIIEIGYNDIKALQVIQNHFYDINKKIFNIQEDEDLTVLRYTLLSQEQKLNKKLDFLGGVVVSDDNFRLYIIEGIAESGLQRLYILIKNDPQFENIKIYRNRDLKFSLRLYLDFNCDLKRVQFQFNFFKIRFLKNLDQIQKDKNMYLTDKIPEQVHNALIKILNLRSEKILRKIEDQNLFPTSQELLSMERYLCTFPNFEYNLYGTNNQSSNMSFKEKLDINRSQNFSNLFKEECEGSPEQSQKQDIVKESKNVSQTLQSLPDLPPLKKKIRHQPKTKDYEPYNMKMKEIYEQPLVQNIFIKSCSNKEIYYQQMQDLKQKQLNDKNYFYTYSKEYLSLSITPYDKQDIKRNELLKEREQFSKNDFIGYNIRSTAEKRQHHKLGQSQIDALHEETYLEKRAKADWIQQPTKELDKAKNILFIQGGEQFQHVQPNNVFEPSSRELEEQKEEIKRQKREKAKEYPSDIQYMKIKYSKTELNQIDKLDNILQGEINKKGFLLPQKKLKSSKLQNLNLEQNNLPLPVSIFMDDKWKVKDENPFLKKMDPNKACGDYKWMPYPLKNKSCVVKLFNNNK